MITTQKAILGAAVAAAVGLGIYQAQRSAKFRVQLQALEQKQESLTAQLAEMTAENERLSRLAHSSSPESPPRNPPSELLRLRGQAGLNARELAEIKSAVTDGKTVSDSLAKIFLNYYSASAQGERGAQNNEALKRVQSISTKLALSPDQQQQVRQILLANVEARTQLQVAAVTGSTPFEEVRRQRDRVDEEEAGALAGVLSADQMNGYKLIKDQESDAAYRYWAQAMVEQIRGPLGLTEEQQQQVALVLYNLKPGEGGINIPFYANAQEQIETRMRALQTILSAEQIEGYRQKLLADTQEHNDIATIAKALKRSQPTP